MPDITMCASKTCPLRESCYRNAASGTEPNPWRQAYFVEKEPVNGKCDQHSPVAVQQSRRIAEAIRARGQA